jgi:hypothetical protein
MKKTIVFAFLFILSACHQDESDLAHAQFSRYSKKAYKEKGLVLEGCGGSMMTDIKELMLSFASPEHLTLDQTRRLVVQTLDEFLNQVNADEKIRPRLHNYPFTPKNIALSIGFRDQGKRPPREYIAYVHLSEGTVYYHHWDATRAEYDQFCDPYKESINDAIKIVIEQEKLAP